MLNGVVRGGDVSVRGRIVRDTRQQMEERSLVWPTAVRVLQREKAAGGGETLRPLHDQETFYKRGNVVLQNEAKY